MVGIRVIHHHSVTGKEVTVIAAVEPGNRANHLIDSGRDGDVHQARRQPLGNELKSRARNCSRYW